MTCRQKASPFALDQTSISPPTKPAARRRCSNTAGSYVLGNLNVMPRLASVPMCPYATVSQEPCKKDQSYDSLSKSLMALPYPDSCTNERQALLTLDDL